MFLEKRKVCHPGAWHRGPGHKTPVRQHRQPFVIAREQCDRGDPVNNKVARMHACINDWIASLRSQWQKGCSSYYLDPVVKPRDDKFLSSFYFVVLLLSVYFVIVFRKKEKCVIPVLDTGTQVNNAVANATHHLHSTLYTLHSKPYTLFTRCFTQIFLGPG